MTTSRSKLRVLDLFSGIGGFSLGLERTGGFETVAFCEIEPYCRRVLAKHWPNVPCYEDVRELTAERLAANGIAVDVICGGFPCQDISLAGKGAGLAGERSGLWAEYARLIRELRPKFVIVENVAALLSRGLADVLGDLAALGYDAEWHCIPAAAVGAPHRRDRLWIVAYPGSEQHESDSAPISRTLAAQLFAADMAVASCELQHGSGDAGTIGRSESSDRRGDVANTESNGRRQGSANTGRCGARSGSKQGAGFSSAGWWFFEPDVGGSNDGFPTWLYRCVGRGMSHAEAVRNCEVLRGLWGTNVAQALWRAAGGLERIQQAEVLFSFVREYEAGSDEARLLVAGKEAPEIFLRSLRQRATSGGAPRRSGQDKQRSSQHSDVVQPMPRLLARNSEADWQSYSWEDAVPRVASGVPARVDRLRALGNAVVPQIPELIGKAILEAEGMTP